jgi:tRNA pseudouridine32 synthase/23S rRNA pseudouridine746 synthase
MNSRDPSVALPGAVDRLMPDVQGSADHRRQPIERVGVRGLRYPMLWQGGAEALPTVSSWAMFVSLPAEQKGTHMSRFVALLERRGRSLSLDALVPLHRIDRETAGLVLFGKRPEDRDGYHALFRQQKIHKTYHAVAAYRPDLCWPQVHTSRLVNGEPFFRMQEGSGVANSETRISLLRHEGQSALYQLEPISGKRHQLRVHMMALGLPLEGDLFYPEVLRGPDEPEDFSQPLQLLAQRIRFVDPVTGQDTVFESQLHLRLRVD